MIKFNKLAFTFFFSTLAACSSTEPPAPNDIEGARNFLSNNPELGTALYYSRCMSRYKNRDYIDLKAKCTCDAELYPRKDLSFKQKYNLCKEHYVREGNQIVPRKQLCAVNTEIKEFNSGDYIQRYRWYTEEGWVNGVYEKHAANLWRVVSVNADGIELELVKGEYYGRGLGEVVTHINTPLYNRHFNNPPQYEQVMQSFMLCENPEL